MHRLVTLLLVSLLAAGCSTGTTKPAPPLTETSINDPTSLAASLNYSWDGLDTRQRALVCAMPRDVLVGKFDLNLTTSYGAALTDASKAQVQRFFDGKCQH